MSVYDEIADERARQDELWGGPAHDDEHDRANWCYILDKFVLKARHATADPSKHRHVMMQIAAIAIAACESHDRKCGRLK